MTVPAEAVASRPTVISARGEDAPGPAAGQRHHAPGRVSAGRQRPDRERTAFIPKGFGRAGRMVRRSWVIRAVPAAAMRSAPPMAANSMATARGPSRGVPHRAAGSLPQRETAQAFSLVYDYTLGFALSDRTTVNEQRVQDPATRRQLHAFFRSLPADRFPALAVLGEHVWAGNRDQRFTAGLDTLLAGLQAAGLQAASQRPDRRQPGR